MHDKSVVVCWKEAWPGSCTSAGARKGRERESLELRAKPSDHSKVEDEEEERPSLLSLSLSVSFVPSALNLQLPVGGRGRRTKSRRGVVLPPPPLRAHIKRRPANVHRVVA